MSFLHRTHPLSFSIGIILLPIVLSFIFLSIYDARQTGERTAIPGVEQKIYDLIIKDQKGADVLIAGDSRAERQVVPSIFSAHTGLSAKNIAVSSGDVEILAYYLKSFGLFDAKHILVISASFPFGNCETNRGLDVFPGIKSLKRSIIDKKLLAVSIVKEQLGETGVQYDNDGFLGISGKIEFPILISTDLKETTHPFYQHINWESCSRWESIKILMRDAEKNGVDIIIYQPPVSPAWRTLISGSAIDEAERRYSLLLAEEAKKYKQTKVIDYYVHPEKTQTLSDEDYYDIQHLNITGAEKFSEILANDVNALLKVCPMNDQCRLSR